MLRNLRASLVFASLATPFFASGCLHSWANLKEKLPGVAAQEPVMDTNTVQNRVESELSAKPAGVLALTMAEELEKGGKHADAIPFYEKARTNDPSLNGRAARRLAVLYDRIGESGKAQTEFQELMKLKPRDADLLNDYGYSLYSRGEWSEAETHFRKALDLNKNHKRALVNLGMTLGQQGRHADSLATFEKAVSPAEAKANLAFIFATKGHKADAEALYQESLKLDPTLRSAQLGLQALEKNQLPESAAVPPSPASVESVSVGGSIPDDE